MDKKVWLKHIESSIPYDARGYTVGMYSIALEGWRRGLNLKFINRNRQKATTFYSLSSGENEHMFTGSLGDLISNEAREICRNKHLTKKYLMDENVSTPQGNFFDKSKSNKEIISYANDLGYPIVIKPSDGTRGNGVIANIKNNKELEESLDYVRGELGFLNLIVEKYFKGVDHRVYVIDDEVVGAYIRIPANVIGDGMHTIRQLIRMKIKERDTNPALFKRPIKIDKELHKMLDEKGYHLSSIPTEGERVFLKTKNNISAGGDPIDVTDDLSDKIGKIAVQAIASIPGLNHGGVDIMVDSERDEGVVLEINTQASIRCHIFPMEGKARDIPKKIIDYYFPDTVSKYEEHAESFYFDYHTIFSLFQKNILRECIVPEIPKGNINTTRFEIVSEKNNKKLLTVLEREILKAKLNGYIKQLVNNNISVVISGKRESTNNIRNMITNGKFTKEFGVDVTEKKRTSPVKVGFELIDNKKSKERNNVTGGVRKNPKIQLSTNNLDVDKHISVPGYYPVRIRDVRRK